MATVEVELRNYQKRKTKIVKGKKIVTFETDGLQPLVLRITIGKQVTRKNTGLYIRAAEWDAAKRRVNRKHSQWTRINDALDVLCKEAEGIKADIIKARQQVTGKAVMSKIFATHDFYEAVEGYQQSLTAEQAGSRANFRAMVSRLKAFAPSLSVEEITPDFLEAFRKHLRTGGRVDKEGKPKGFSPNTITGTLSLIRTVLNTLNLKGEDPFKQVTIGGYQAAKADALSVEDIEKLRAYEPKDESEQLAVDAFLFSFYAAGMRSADVLQLRWSSIKGGRIIYEQNKKLHQGAGALSIPLNAVTTEILSRYDHGRPTVFGLVKTFGGSAAAIRERMTAQHRILRTLKKVAEACGIEKALTFKLARTSFGRIANEVSGRNVYGIQQAMGHSNVKTTEIYLGSDVRAVDELLGVVYA